MKILIAILSCRRDARNGFNQAIRDTWLKDISKFPDVDYKFFVGDGTTSDEYDEAALQAKSIGFDGARGIDYEDKFRQSAKDTAVEPPIKPQADEIILPVPDDYTHVVVKVQGIFRWAYAQGYDFVFKCETDTYVNIERLMASGFENHDFIGGPNGKNVAGGSGWWVSRRAMSLITDTRITEVGDDSWFPTIARSKALEVFHDVRYRDESVTSNNNIITTHAGFMNGYTPARMFAIHRGEEVSSDGGKFEYTLVITSCNRHPLLLRTLDSFIQYSDVKPKATIIVEDGGVNAPDWIKCEHQTRNLPNKVWITNNPKLGQVGSIDRAYSEVTTEYIFHCEDDWEFLAPGFIFKSYEILNTYPHISQVNLRGDSWGHTLVNDPRYPFKIAEPGWGGGYGGLAWNPGLRRLSDYKNVFGTFATYDVAADGHVAAERQRLSGLGIHSAPGSSCDAWKETYYSKVMLANGFNIASLNRQYVQHIGGGHSVTRPGNKGRR